MNGNNSHSLSHTVWECKYMWFGYPSIGRKCCMGSYKAIWLGAGADILSFKTKTTEVVEYESSEEGHFSEDVTCTISYTQPDPKKPVGQYSGKVRLTALMTP